ARPELKRPTEVPKRKINRGTAGRGALLHALAHIELNAIDLAADIVARFTAEALPRGFYDDWLTVADEEGKHYLLLAERLAALGFAYGDLPAHDGLWQAAEETAHDLLARLAVVPLVLEARGLDVTPAMIAKLRQVDDHDSAAVLQVIYAEEVGHVAIGKRWFDALCARRGLEPQETWQALVRRHFKGRLKPPFNEPARREAGLPADFYAALAEE
ncbi:MAG TPA: ferritin-like domain-containing protein, partial [Kiloniellaceae bacterium]